MSRNQLLQNSYGPEVTPYENETSVAPEYNGPQQDHEQPRKEVHHESQRALPEEASAEKERVAGLPVAVFWTVIIVLVVLVLAVGIGVGVGVGLKNNSGEKASSDAQPTTTGDALETTSSTSQIFSTPQTLTETKTSTTTLPTSRTIASDVPVTTGTHGIAANSCNFTVPRSYLASDGTTFLQRCFTDWPEGGDALNGKGTVSDVHAAISYTFEQCMEECLSYNKDAEDDSTLCAGVTYNANLTSSIEVGDRGGNCFLKNTPGVDLPASAEAASAAIAF